jgi:hypothetical protein
VIGDLPIWDWGTAEQKNEEAEEKTMRLALDLVNAAGYFPIDT